MARGKQQQQQKDGQHRKETKEERRARLQAEQEAKEQCLKILPYVGAAVVAFLLLFALYVRSVPVKAKVDQPTVTHDYTWKDGKHQKVGAVVEEVTDNIKVEHRTSGAGVNVESGGVKVEPVDVTGGGDEGETLEL